MKNIPLIFFLICYIQFANASTEFQTIDLHKSSDSRHIAEESYLLISNSQHFTAEDIIGFPADSFTQSPALIPYLGFTNKTYWAKIDIKNPFQTSLYRFIETARPLTNVVEFYLYDENGILVSTFHTGDELPFINRPIKYKGFIFPINFQANSSYTLLFKYSSDGEILKLPIKLWTKEEFIHSSNNESFYIGLYYGLFILVITLFSFFGIALRQKLYLYFVSYVFFLGLFQLSLGGLAYQYLWPNSVWFGNHAVLIFAAISMILMLFYVKNFLDFSKKHPQYLKVYNGFIILLTIGLFMSLGSGLSYQYSFPLLNGLSLISILYILYGIILKYRTDDKPELPLVLAYLSLCIGSISFILANVNVLESEFIASNGLKVGSAFEIIFLSLAMAGRYRKTQIDKIAAQEESYQSLAQLNKLKKDQNIRLEKEVASRTEELSLKSEILFNKNQEVINSINYAKRLQDAILPSKSELSNNLPDHGLVYLPKDIVSGDFYWTDSTEDYVFFAVADCTGHGVPGAMVSMLGYNALNRCVRELQLTKPAEILNQLTDIIETTFSKKENQINDGMDISLCVWDRKKTLQFAGAFNPLYIVRNNQLEIVKGDKQPIGKYPKRHAFNNHCIEIEKGDSFYLFTDGFADQFGGEKNKKLKYVRFQEYLQEFNSTPTELMQEELIQRFHQWKGENEQIDDVCLLNVRF